MLSTQDLKNIGDKATGIAASGIGGFFASIFLVFCAVAFLGAFGMLSIGLALKIFIG